MGADDKDADGEVPEFEFRHGPGTRVTEGEMEEIEARGNPMIVLRAHLRSADFLKFRYTDRCGGCSARPAPCRPLQAADGETPGEGHANQER